MRVISIVAIASLSAACDRAPTSASLDQQPACSSPDPGFALIPFDPSLGIAFKHGRSFSNSAAEIAAFEKLFGVRLPADFVRMIGDWCEGGFDGCYRVADGDSGRVAWWSMLLMKLPDAVDREQQARLNSGPIIVKDVIQNQQGNFTDKSGKLTRLPFGKASCLSGGSSVDGHLAFDLLDSMAIVFVPIDGSPPRRIAASFQEMMASASLEHYG